jgi:hypothetical protein
MRIHDRLIALDQHVLPPISTALRRLGRGARRLRIVRIVTPVLALAVVLVAVYAAGRPSVPASGPIGTSVRLGVRQGDSIPAYVATSKSDLANLLAANASIAKPPKYFALVSLTDYLTPAALTALFDGLNLQITNTIMRVPSDRQTQIIPLSVTHLPDELERGMLNTADKKRQAALDDTAQLKLVTGNSDTDDTLRAQYRLQFSVDSLEADSYQAYCACVYAVVVYGDVPVLAQLAARTGVRAVEAKILQFPDLAVFLPPFPDEHDRAEPPPSSAP